MREEIQAFQMGPVVGTQTILECTENHCLGHKIQGNALAKKQKERKPKGVLYTDEIRRA